MSRAPFVMLGATLALAACMQSTPASEPYAGAAPSGFQNQTWELETVNGALFSPRPVRATAVFDGSTYQFAGACNTTSGTYHVAGGGALSVGPSQTTTVACNDPKDAEFFGMMNNLAQLRMTRAGLVLVTADGRELGFRPYGI